MRRLLFLLACGLALLVPMDAQALAAGTVEGTVTPIAWAQEVKVCVAETVPSELCVFPEADGSYSFHGLETGVKLEFIPTYRSRLLPQYYKQKSTLAEAEPIFVPAEPHHAENIDASLVEGGSISGSVTAADGREPLSEVEVCAASVASPTVKSCDETDASGGYELHSLPTGSYKVGFWGSGRSAGFEPSYYQGQQSREQATPVSVTAGVATAGIDASLAEGGQIRGLVSAAAGGAPLAGISVCLFAASESSPQRCTYSGETGTYSFLGLPSASYEVGFSLDLTEIGIAGTAGEAGGFLPQYYDGVDSRAQATKITVLAPGTVAGIDARLAAPPAPPSPARLPILATSIVGAAAPVAEPRPHRKNCKNGYRGRKTKNGKVRCVKVAKHHGRHHRHKHRKIARKPGRRGQGRRRQRRHPRRQGQRHPRRGRGKDALYGEAGNDKLIGGPGKNAAKPG